VSTPWHSRKGFRKVKERNSGTIDQKEGACFINTCRIEEKVRMTRREKWKCREVWVENTGKLGGHSGQDLTLAEMKANNNYSQEINTCLPVIYIGKERGKKWRWK